MISFDNNKNGKHTILCKNTGQIILEKHYLNNLLHGEYVYYWSNGRIRFSGTFSKNKRVGTMGDCGVFSFHGTKMASSGEGGMFITNNKDYYMS